MGKTVVKKHIEDLPVINTGVNYNIVSTLDIEKTNEFVEGIQNFCFEHPVGERKASWFNKKLKLGKEPSSYLAIGASLNEEVDNYDFIHRAVLDYCSTVEKNQASVVVEVNGTYFAPHFKKK